MDSIYADDSEAQAIEALTATWEGDAQDELSDSQGVEEEPTDIEEEPELEAEAEDESEGTEQEETPEDDEGELEEAEPEAEEEVDEDLQEPETVTVKVDGEEVEVSIEALKRLHGQETALTRKSQEVADQRKQLEQKEAHYEASLEQVLSTVKTEYEEYANIDWMVAEKQLSDEEFTALRTEALKVQQKFQSVTSEVGTYLKEKEATLQAQLSEKATEAHKQLLEADIGWSKELHTDLVDFAVSNGIPKETMDSIVDAPFFKILNKAYQADKTVTKAVVKKKVKTPKKVITSKNKPQAINPNSGRNKSLEKNLAQSGSEDDAIALLLNEWK